MVILFTTVFATMAVIEDRTQGFLQQMAVAPASRASMVLGKVAGVTTVAMVQAALCLAIAPLAGFSLGAIAWPELIVALILGSMGLTSLSFCLAWLVTSTHAYHALMSVFLLPLWMVSGAMFPAPESGVVRVIMDLNPMTYCVETLRHALHGGPAGGVDRALRGGVIGRGVAETAHGDAVTRQDRVLRPVPLAVM